MPVSEIMTKHLQQSFPPLPEPFGPTRTPRGSTPALGCPWHGWQQVMIMAINDTNDGYKIEGPPQCPCSWLQSSCFPCPEQQQQLPFPGSENHPPASASSGWAPSHLPTFPFPPSLVSSSSACSATSFFPISWLPRSLCWGNWFESPGTVGSTEQARGAAAPSLRTEQPSIPCAVHTELSDRQIWIVNGFSPFCYPCTAWENPPRNPFTSTLAHPYHPNLSRQQFSMTNTSLATIHPIFLIQGPLFPLFSPPVMDLWHFWVAWGHKVTSHSNIVMAVGLNCVGTWSVSWCQETVTWKNLLCKPPTASGGMDKSSLFTNFLTKITNGKHLMPQINLPLHELIAPHSSEAVRKSFIFLVAFPSE